MDNPAPEEILVLDLVTFLVTTYLKTFLLGLAHLTMYEQGHLDQDNKVIKV